MSKANRWLDSTRQNGMALGLANTYSMIQRLNLDFSSTKIIHVAGSNGKGSACSLMAASLTMSGISNLLFTSPHVSRIEERFRVDCKPISNELFQSMLEKIYRSAIGDVGQESIKLTFFETTFLIAILCAIESKVEFIIVETGLGGRLDATRCIPADACLLTSISCEHTDILGETLEQITSEKAAIARPNKPIVIRDMENESFKKAVIQQCENAGNESIGEVKSPATPHFVIIPDNYSIKDEAEILVQELFKILEIPCTNISQAKNRLRWPARMQIIETESNILLLDAAHNPSGLLRVIPELKENIETLTPLIDGKKNWTLIYGTSPQQNLTEMLDYVSRLCRPNPPNKICLTRPLGGRYPGVDTSILAQYKWPIDDVKEFENAEMVFEYLSKFEASDNGLIVSLGSLYLQGNILNYLGLDSDEELSILPKQS